MSATRPLAIALRGLYNAVVTDRKQQRRPASARRMAGWLGGWGLIWLVLAGPGLAAQPVPPADPDGPPAPAASASESPPPDDAALAASLMVSPSASARQQRAECNNARNQGEIVVCGADRGEQWRVPSTADSDPTSRQGQSNGVPRAPNVSSLPDCAKIKCRSFGGVPPPVYVVDFSKLPEAPTGSEADQIAKGERPAP